MATTSLPELPRPDLPASHPENYPTLRLRVFRQLGLPDDGGLWLSDAIDSDVLRAYGGIVVHDDEYAILIDFASLHGAVSWAEGITATGTDRAKVIFPSPPENLYAPVVVRISLR